MILSHMWNTYIHLSIAVEIQYAWKYHKGIPGIVGALNDTHIAIKKPSNRDEAEIYWNGKSFYSINI